MSKHVLIIDDNELLVKMYRSIFRAMQCSVAHASTMTDALNLLSTTRADLVILDDRLAHGSTEVSRDLRSRLAATKTPIIATVSRPKASNQEAMRDAGYDSIVTKPFQVNVLSALARHKLAEHTTAMGAI
jgi:DNA-binding response OmpR family regulator